ncbi:ATP-binding cassette domain-containing protein [Arthrobacter sp. NA-172]|uniref:ATP-binding cassette domain-containing protein n=1 Tax=Arthrobacter sp. NA-172 TaxID=3367524 RepID=UPI003754ACD4
MVQGAAAGEARARVQMLLDQVGLPRDAAERLPREFSGGQRQRVAIARALAPKPKLIVCDEPVSALDLSTQARVMDLFIDIQRSTGAAYLFVSHDLQSSATSATASVPSTKATSSKPDPRPWRTSTPEHPYTQKLLLAAPIADPVEAAHEKRESVSR